MSVSEIRKLRAEQSVARNSLVSEHLCRVAVTHNSRLPTQQLSRFMSMLRTRLLGCLTNTVKTCYELTWLPSNANRTNDSFQAARSGMWGSGPGGEYHQAVLAKRGVCRSTAFSSIRGSDNATVCVAGGNCVGSQTTSREWMDDTRATASKLFACNADLPGKVL